MIAAVFFDVDDTLVDYDPTARSALQEALGADADYDSWIALDHYERFNRGELGFEQMRYQRMADYLAAAGIDGDPEDLERRRFTALERSHVLFDDVLPCLTRLHRFRLGLITNNDGAHQRHKLRLVSLDRSFDAVIISAEVGVAKPDQRIFHAACDALGVSPEQAAHVGDRLHTDAMGAAAAGLRGIWLNRSGAGPEPPPGIDVVRSLAELPTLLADVNAAA